MKKSNIKQAFNSELNSFNVAIRFIFEKSGETLAKLPAAPAKDDKSANAKDLRAEIKSVEKSNGVITDCKAICNIFNITANSLKRNNIKELRAQILAFAPHTTAGGVAVSFTKLPAYMKNTIHFDVVRIVSASSWIDTILDAAENAQRSEVDRIQRNDYTLTTRPIVIEGAIETQPEGSFVDAEGNTLTDTANIIEDWSNYAIAKHLANRAGRATHDATFDSEILPFRK